MVSSPNNLLIKNNFSTQMHEVLPDSELIGAVSYPKKLQKDIQKIANIQHQIDRIKNNKNPVLKRRLVKDLTSIKSRLEKARKVIIAGSFKLYVNAYKAELPMLLGGEELRGAKAKEEMMNWGILSGGKHQIPKNILPDVPNTTTGSILCDGSWCLLKNDAAMLGTIHSGKNVYGFGSLLDSDLWDTENNRPKVMGREIAMLYSAGYRQISSKKQVQRFGPLFVCLDKSKSSRVTLNDLIKGANQVKKLQDLHSMLQAPEKINETTVK